MIKVILLTFCLSLTAVNLFSQDLYVLDSLKKGVSYRFVLYDDSEIIGKVTGRDSVYIFVKADDGSYRLKKDDVFFISRNLIRNKYKAILSLGAGISILNTDHHQYVESNYKNKISLQFSSLFPIGEYKGIRLDAGYSGWKKDETIDYYSENSYSKTGPISKDYYYLKGDFVFGLLAPENRFWIYGSAGIGIHLANESSYYNTHSYYSTYDSTYHINTYNQPERRYVSAGLSIGAALGYRITDRFGIYADTQLNTIGYGGFFLFFWGGEGTYVPIRAGITYTIF